MPSKTVKQKGDRVANAFSRFPMLMVTIIKVLLRCDRDTSLDNFCKSMKVPRAWFKETCENSKIFNTFPLNDISVFKFYTKVESNKEVDYIKLEDESMWVEQFNNACSKILRV